VNPRFRPDAQALEEVWKDLLSFEEHTFNGGRDPVLRARHSKTPVATESTRLLEHVLMRGTSALADAIQVPTGTLVVFNPLNWRRSRLVEFTLARNQQLVEVASNQPVPVEELPAGGGARRVRFLAADVPAMGYRSYAIRQAQAPAAAPPAESAATLENAWYRVTLDPASGAIRGVFDKELGRELVDAANPYRFNQYLNVTGNQDSRNRSALSTKIVPPPELEIHAASGGKLISVAKTAWGSVARLESSAPNTPRIATEIVLLDGQKRIEITNRLQKTAAPSGEWGYFAFPFAMDRPQFRYEIQNGVVNPAKDTLPGGSREWQTVQHWAAVDQDDVTAAVVPVDAPLVAFGDVIRYRWPKEFGDRKAVIFSHVLQRAAPGPELTFRYVVTSGRRLQAATLSRVGWDAMSPFETNELVREDKVGNPPRPLGAAEGSFLEVDHPGVVLVTWKRAEDGAGTILRFAETSGQAASVRVTTPLLRVERAWMANSVEENQQALAVTPDGFGFNARPFSVVTVRVEGTPRLASPGRR
jgi:alpha-mannosidase